MCKNDYSHFKLVTEVGGELVSKGQIERFVQRYTWAGKIVRGIDVLELACGAGPGLGHLVSQAQSLVAGDISRELLALAEAHYGSRVDLRKLDACKTGLESASFDAVILFEAIYYLQNVHLFLDEVYRLLRPGGQLLLATANKDLVDFNPSPFSFQYFNPPELSALLGEHGFDSAFFGGSPVPSAGFKNQTLRSLKRFAAGHRLIPKSMNGKRILKRLVFGSLKPMPRDLTNSHYKFVAPVPIPANFPDDLHQVLYCLARKC